MAEIHLKIIPDQFFGIRNIHSVYMQKRCKELVIDIGQFANTLRQ